MKTAECVSPKHPDKMCDQISDAILDFCLKQDSNARVAVETMGGHGKVIVMGEISLKGKLRKEDIEEIVERIAGQELEVSVRIEVQSKEIAQGVDTGGAGDQGIMIGYACDENEARIPRETWLARNLCQSIYSKHPFDGKTQITLNNDGEIKTIVASFQNTTELELLTLVNEWLQYSGIGYEVSILCNPAGDWNIGGFDADTGLTGRKLMVDNYGPQIAIGGGCFSGKDATKVDRSAAYMARKMAVVILNEREAREVYVKLAYAIGIAEPVMAIAIVNGVEENLEPLELLTPKAIIDTLDLKKPQYEMTAMWGHFGNEFTWDK